VIVVAPLGEIQASLAWLIISELLTSAFILGVLALLGRWLIRRGLAPVSRMATTAHGIAGGGDLRARMEVSDSEVGRLAGAINVMLDRIEQAFVARVRSEAKVREFAADASHELRTPLTTIRGYSELYEQGAVDADEAMRRISSESERMRRLVEELLELARLDKGSALTMERVDLAAVARDAVADASAVEPDRPLTLDAPESMVAMADEGRIRQVLANLLANVRAHTPPGTPALVRLTETSTTMIIEVADEGPGMVPDEAARAFDRFHHASGGDGTGLGLAIVAAIAAAHGGRAMLRSSPGRGTGVRIELARGEQVLEGVVQLELPEQHQRGQR
jgi:two-component system OmpR family sensor kinase